MNTVSSSAAVQPIRRRETAVLCNEWTWRFACCAVALFGFFLCWVAGHRGIFLTDQSMVFDGAWRLLQGQVPYRDVFYPFGPVTFLLQAAFFKVFGVNYSSAVLAAAVLNGIAGLLVIRIVHRLLPVQQWIALLAGLLTTCWFQAPFGTLWFEQTAFFFALLALWLVIEAEVATNSSSHYLHILAGFSMALSTLSKQNAGLLFCPVIAGVVVFSRFREPRKALIGLSSQLTGFMFGMACFLLWVWRFSDLHSYYHYSIEMTRSLAAERTPPIGLLLNNILSLSVIPIHLRWGALLFALIAIFAILAGLLFEQPRTTARIYLLVGWTIIACLEFQQLFIMVTNNDDENSLPFLGLAGGLAMGILLQWIGHQDIGLSLSSDKQTLRATLSWKLWRSVAIVATLAVFAIGMRRGIETSWHRYIQQFTDQSHFDETLNVTGLHNLRWADFQYGGVPGIPQIEWLRRSDFEGLNAWLDQHPGNFFVFPDATILYGLHAKPSPQPWLYFQEDHSFARTELPLVDERVVASLRRYNIQTVVLEKASWNSHNLIDRMPELQSWIDDNFRKEKDFGIFEVWTAKSN